MTVDTTDWATQAYLNLAALLDGLPETPHSATLKAFLAQAPATIRDTVEGVRSEANLPSGLDAAIDAAYADGSIFAENLPRVGDWVRVDDDRGTGVLRAIGQVTHVALDDGSIKPWLTVSIGDGLYELWLDGVHVVHYDRKTQTWVDGRP